MRTIVIIIFSLTFGLYSCNNFENPLNHAKENHASGLSIENTDDDEVLSNGNTENIIETSPNQSLKNLKLIKHGALHLSCSKIDHTYKKISKKLNSIDGYIASEKNFKNQYGNSIRLQVRIPSKQFDKFINNLALGKDSIIRKEINIEDVTNSFFDNEARLRTLKTLENRYLNLLKQSNKIKDMLDIESEIQDLRYKIERLEGKHIKLKNRIEYSDLSILLEEKQVKIIRAEKPNEILNAFNNGWYILKAFLFFLISIWPLLIVAIMVYLFINFKKKRNKK
ncbi:MAG: DUF4349 domain-containing protein [Flavobacteriales bacterium]